ncbi:MAG: aminotransferase class III-fold pyridoxal phosphate-dependent enzyme [Alteromonadaceae bacterium]|nr:aminotransferase class III-fold pyridoxal phosphate-dependent enzyme [Alteromonadaceae bacterium]
MTNIENLSESVAVVATVDTAITPSFTVDEINQLLQQHYQLSGSLKSLPGYCDQNLLLTEKSGKKAIVKIANSGEAKIELAMQNAAMAHLTAKEIAVPHCINNLRGETLTAVTRSITTPITKPITKSLSQPLSQSKTTAQNTQIQNGEVCFYLRVLTFFDGDFYADANIEQHNSTLWGHLGEFIGQMNVALADFEHSGTYRYLEWDLAQGYRVCQSKKYLFDSEQKPHLKPEPKQDQKPEQYQLVEYFLNLYQTQTMSVLVKCPQGVIHNDANDYNLLIDDVLQPTKITGLIDFGDMVHSHLINELAITAAYALMGQENPLETLKSLVAGYHKIRPLKDEEFEVLFSLIALRLCVSVCNSALAIKQHPDNDYLLVSAKPAWQLLKKMCSMNVFSVLCQLRQACQMPVDTGKNNDDIIAYRKKHLGKTLSLSYQEPLKIVRGQGAYLYDESGNAYLDMVNNVCHVGHCHPKVVAAGQEQQAKLNTNTRYLHDNLVNYADKLLATMPDELSVCMLVNSGSEANELAFRLARGYSKSKGFNSKELLVVDGAYHGNTNACIEASPYKFDGPGGEGAPNYVHKVALADPYRGQFSGNSVETAHAYAEDVSKVIKQLAEQGKKPSAFICESLQGVAGQIIMPDGYLTAVYQKVRAAGGVCIADEVQVGFGRVGTHMWAFETQAVVPDIVTLGKPIGNGHPMAAVITTQAIADAFVTGMEYFNTFGGNPVSCAIGIAVLDAINEDKLQENALSTGNYFQEKLRQLQLKFDLIGDVRGLGLFIGVELVEDRNTKQPATDKTAQLVEYFKQNHILLSTEGPFYNILKIKPPLAFNKDDADKFIAVFEAGLKIRH